MRSVILLLVAIAAALGAEDPWAKVNDIKSGAEVRIYKRDGKPPLVAKFDEAREDAVVIVVKNQQIAVPKDEIDRIDARPVKKGGGPNVETKTTTRDPDARDHIPGPNAGPARPTTESSSSVVFGSKPDFETIYRRPSGPSKK